jgi:hypothetical protein
LPTARPQLMQPVIDELRRFGITIDAIVPLRQSLEDYFIDVVRPGAPPFPPAGPATIMMEGPHRPPPTDRVDRAASNP